MSSKHTPGPWVVREAQGRNINFFEIEIFGGNPRWLEKVAVVYGSTNPMLDTMVGAKYNHANARLIAAAPELLEALEGYMSAVDQMNAAMDDGINVQGALSAVIGWADRANAAIAIAKATGE